MQRAILARELSDRVAVMSGGRITHVVAADGADRMEIGKYMAGHA